MVLAGNDQIVETLNDIITKQKEIDKRVERLETLEFEKYAKSDGCVRWLDDDIVSGAAAARVDVPANPYELGDYGWTHLTVFYGLSGTKGATLHMQYNGLAGANYGYTYKWAVGGAYAGPVSADGQTSIIIGRLQVSYTTGWIHVPYFPIPLKADAFGTWTAEDTAAAPGAQVEGGEFFGTYQAATPRVTRIDLFASAGNVTGYVYLYGWCPTWDIGTGPPD